MDRGGKIVCIDWVMPIFAKKITVGETEWEYYTEINYWNYYWPEFFTLTKNLSFAP